MDTCAIKTKIEVIKRAKLSFFIAFSLFIVAVFFTETDFLSKINVQIVLIAIFCLAIGNVLIFLACNLLKRSVINHRLTRFLFITAMTITAITVAIPPQTVTVHKNGTRLDVDHVYEFILTGKSQSKYKAEGYRIDTPRLLFQLVSIYLAIIAIGLFLGGRPDGDEDQPKPYTKEINGEVN